VGGVRGWVMGKMHFQERKKLTRSNLVNMLMSGLLANKLMVLASRRVFIYGMLLVGYIWPKTSCGNKNLNLWL